MTGACSGAALEPGSFIKGLLLSFRETEKQITLCLRTDGLFLVCALTRDEQATLIYQDDALTNGAGQPGPRTQVFSFSTCQCLCVPER